MISDVSLDVPDFVSSQLLRAPKGHYVELNFTLETRYVGTCAADQHLVVRNGYNESADLLGLFCGKNIVASVRSSGRNLWLRKSSLFRNIYRFWSSYCDRTVN